MRNNILPWARHAQPDEQTSDIPHGFGSWASYRPMTSEDPLTTALCDDACCCAQEGAEPDRRTATQTAEQSAGWLAPVLFVAAIALAMLLVHVIASSGAFTAR